MRRVAVPVLGRVVLAVKKSRLGVIPEMSWSPALVVNTKGVGRVKHGDTNLPAVTTKEGKQDNKGVKQGRSVEYARSHTVALGGRVSRRGWGM